MYQPIASSSRIQLVDCIRGFCLLGIILANVPIPEHTNSLLLNLSSWNSNIRALVNVFISTKFITIFSILFGFGFSIQLNRAAEKGINFKRYFFLRMLLLFGIGCLHAYLLWFGDIIRYYAICGMLLLVIHQISTKRLFRLSILFTVFITAIVFILNEALSLQHYSYDYSIATKIYHTANYGTYLRYNFTIDPMVNFIQDSPITFVSCFGKILFGYWLGRISFFQKEGWTPMLKKWLYFGFIFGFAGSILFWAVSSGILELDVPLLWLPFFITGGLFIHSLFYLSLFIRLYRFNWGKKILLFFAPMGRMALSNYLIQTLFYLFLLFKWTNGPDLYGKINALESYLLALLFFFLQVLFSRWWFHYFSQGPVEGLWKYLAYAKTKSNSPSEE